MQSFVADGLLSLSAPYASSLTLIRSLLDLLTTFPPLPPSLTGSTTTTNPVHKPGAESKGKPEAPATRPSAEELQAAMSLLAVQPLIPGKGREGGPDAWEEVMAVEVGGWV